MHGRDWPAMGFDPLSARAILFGGHEVPTLTGHLDLSKPLVLNKRFIAAS